MIRIAIADDHALFRKSLSRMLGDFEELQVVAEASNGAELLEIMKAVSVDTLLLDLRMPVMDGFETAERVHQLFPSVSILVLTMMDDDSVPGKIMDYADDFFTKNVDPEVLRNAILMSVKPAVRLAQQLSRNVSSTSEMTPEDRPTVTVQEKVVITLTAMGQSNKAIAENLHISNRTVERHKENLRTKFHVSSFTQVIILALKYHAIALSDVIEYWV